MDTPDRLSGGEAARARVEVGDNANPNAEADRAAVAATVAAKAKPRTKHRSRRKMTVPGRDPLKPAVYLAAAEDDEEDQQLDDVAKPRTEAELWRANLAVLRAAVEERKPGTLKKLEREIQRMTAEADKVEQQKALVPASEAKDQQGREDDLERRRALLELTLRRMDEEARHLAQRRAGMDNRVERRQQALSLIHRRITQRLKQLQSLEGQAKRRPAKKEDEGKTPDRIDKPAIRNTIELLEQRRKISEEQARAAQTIQAIHEAVAAAGQLHAVNLEGAGGHGGFSDIVISSTLDAVRSRKYLPWLQAMNESTPIAAKIVLAIAVDGKSLDAAAREYGIRRAKALGYLKFGLDAYRRQRRVEAKPREQKPPI